MPSSFQPRPQSHSSSSNQRASSPAKKKSTNSAYNVSVRLNIIKFEIDSGVPRIWFSATHAPNTKLTKFYLSLPENLRKHDDRMKIWTFNFDLYDKISSQLQADEFDVVELNDLPRFLVEGLKKYIKKVTADNQDVEADPELKIETGLLDTLLPFQLEGIKFVVRHGGKALIGDEMGCGKTIQAIGVMQHYRQHWPVLLLVMPGLMAQWTSEILKFSGDILRPKDIVNVRKGSDVVGGKVCLVPYSVLDKLVESRKLRTDMFGIVIADESHNLKNKDAKRTNSALPFLKQATVSLCLTGTPATNRPVELYTQLNGLLPHVFNNYDIFIKRYCDAKPAHFGSGMDARGSSNEAELKMLLEGMIMIRRMKADVVRNLPEKSREVRHVLPDPKTLVELKKLQKKKNHVQLAIQDSSNDPSTTTSLNHELQALSTQMYTLTGISKVEAIKQELAKLIEESRTEKLAAEAADDAITAAASKVAQDVKPARGSATADVNAQGDVGYEMDYDERRHANDTVEEHMMDQSEGDDDDEPATESKEPDVPVRKHRAKKTDKSSSSSSSSSSRRGGARSVVCHDPSAVLMKLEDDGHGLFDFEEKKEAKRSANDDNGKGKDSGKGKDKGKGQGKGAGQSSNGAVSSSSSAKVQDQDQPQPQSGADDDNASDNLVDSDDDVAKTISDGSAPAPSHSSTAKSIVGSPAGKGGSSGGGRLLKGRLSRGGHVDDRANDDDEEDHGAFDKDKQRLLEVAASGQKNKNKALIDLSEEALELIADNRDYDANFVLQSQRSRRISSAISQPQEPRLKKLRLLSATKSTAPFHHGNEGSSYEEAASIEDSDDNDVDDTAPGSQGSSSEGDLSSSDDVFFRHAKKKKRKIAKKGDDTKGGKGSKKIPTKSTASQQRSKGTS